MNLYQCKWCHKILERDSKSKKVRSYCRKAGRYVNLAIVEKTDKNYRIMEASKDD